MSSSDGGGGIGGGGLGGVDQQANTLTAATETPHNTYIASCTAVKHGLSLLHAAGLTGTLSSGCDQHSQGRREKNVSLNFVLFFYLTHTRTRFLRSYVLQAFEDSCAGVKFSRRRRRWGDFFFF